MAHPYRPFTATFSRNVLNQSRCKRPRSSHYLTASARCAYFRRGTFSSRASSFSTATNPKVVVTARAFPQTADLLSSAGLNVVSNQCTEPWTREELISHAHDAQAILAFMTDSVDEDLLDACPNLQLIACALKGYDNFCVDLCAERGVAVTAVPDLLTEPTAELALLLALGLGRRIREADDVVRSGQFQGWRPTLYGTGLADATVGIYGAGAVGQAVAKRIRGFGPKRIIYRDIAAAPATNVEPQMESADNLDELMQQCDFVFVCTPLNKTTFHAIDAEILAKAKPGLLLVNVSRGSCVDEGAVADALHSDLLGGYAADVFEFEDWILDGRPKDIDPRLMSHPRTLFSPHLGSAVTTTRRDIELAAAEEIVRWSRSEPYLYRVN